MLSHLFDQKLKFTYSIVLVEDTFYSFSAKNMIFPVFQWYLKNSNLFKEIKRVTDSNASKNHIYFTIIKKREDSWWAATTGVLWALPIWGDGDFVDVTMEVYKDGQQIYFTSFSSSTCEFYWLPLLPIGMFVHPSHISNRTENSAIEYFIESLRRDSVLN